MKKFEDFLNRMQVLLDEAKKHGHIIVRVEDLENAFPELKEHEDERIRKALIRLHKSTIEVDGIKGDDIITWLENQGKQKPTQEIEPFEAEHGKYYYCIKDYFCGGKKQASKGDVIQALRGLPIMGLKDASEYFLPVNFIKRNTTWDVDDKSKVQRICQYLNEAKHYYADITEVRECMEWLKSLEDRIGK